MLARQAMQRQQMQAPAGMIGSAAPKKRGGIWSDIQADPLAFILGGPGGAAYSANRRAEAEQKAQFEQMISTLPQEQQMAARLNPEEYGKNVASMYGASAPRPSAFNLGDGAIAEYDPLSRKFSMLRNPTEKPPWTGASKNPDTGEWGFDPNYVEGMQKMRPPTGGGPPSGYRFTNSGMALEAIPGGPSDPEAEGDASLSDDAMTNAAIRYNITGTLPPMGAGKSGVKVRSEILDRAAAIAMSAGQSGEDLAAAGAQYMANRRALSDLQTRRTTISTFEKMFEKNLDLAMEMGKKVDNNGIPLWNKFVNSAGRETGDPDIAAFKAALYAAGNEYAKIVSGATGAAGITDSAREEVDHIINTGMSNGQLSAVADVMRREVQNRTHGMDEEYDRLSGLIRGGGSTKASGSQPGDMPSPKSRAERDALPSGTQYRAPNGQVMTKR